jgi:hypothetical protein
MNHELNEATEFLQRELNDSLYKAEYDDETKTHDVLRFRKNLKGEGGYYALQKSYDHPIDNRVIEDFKKHDLKGKELKLVFLEMERQKEKARKESLAKVGLYAGDMARDLSRFLLHPVIISIPKLRK